MNTGFTTAIPVDESKQPLSSGSRANHAHRYRWLQAIIEAAQRGDVDTVVMLAKKI
jgi:hypothetical protein